MQELSVAFVNLINDINPAFWILIFAIGGTLSVVWVVSLATRMANSSTPGNPPVTMREIFGVLLLASFVAHYSGSLNIFSETVGFGNVDFGVLSYVGSESALGEFAEVINAALTFVAMMGGIFGLKGLMLLHQKVTGASREGDAVLKALIHIIGGGLLVRLTALLDAAAASAK